MRKGKRTEHSPGIRTGRVQDDEFHHLISPLGNDAAETPTYSPDECVDAGQDSNQRREGPHEAGEYRRNERRGG